MNLYHAALVALATTTTLGIASISAFAQTTSYYTSGFYDYTVGAGVTTLDVTLAGAFGGSPGYGSGGNGGLMTARFSGLTAGQTLRIIIGEGQNANNDPISNGSAGIGTAGGSRGGELSAIAFGSGTNLSSLTYLLIAGGGGGANGGNGGAGGGVTGGDGEAVPIVGAPSPGLGGTQFAGGAAGTASGANATSGSYLQGGNASTTGSTAQNTGGGGGGGYYGGGGATGTAGGGGGSSFSSAMAVNGVSLSNVVNTQGGAVYAVSDESGPVSPGSIGGAGYATVTVVAGAAAPEPNTFAMLMPVIGVVGTGFLRRRKK